MNVVHVVRQFHPSVGGMEEVVLKVAKHHLARGEDQVRVVTLDRVFGQPQARLAVDDIHQGVPVKRIPYAGSKRYPLAFSVLSEIADADVVHVHGIDFFFDYLALTLPVHRKPMVVSTHGGFFHTAYASRMKRLWFQTVTRASSLGYRRVIATSENDGEVFAAVVSPQRLRVIQNGVDIDKFASKASSSPGKTILSFGRWSVNKGLMETLDVFAALHAADPQWRLIIAGRQYDLTEADLRAAIATRMLGEAVSVHAAPSDEDLSHMLARCQYFICLSRHEGFGIAPIEAMSAGLVPILSAIPPFAKLVRESGVGLLLGSSVQDDAAAIAALAAVDAEAFAARRQQAIAQAARHHWRHAVDQYIEEYRLASRRREYRTA